MNVWNVVDAISGVFKIVDTHFVVCIGFRHDATVNVKRDVVVGVVELNRGDRFGTSKMSLEFVGRDESRFSDALGYLVDVSPVYLRTELRVPAL